MNGPSRARGRAGVRSPALVIAPILAALIPGLAAPGLAAEIPVSGLVRDAEGAAVAGARVSLHPLPGPKPAPETSGDATAEAAAPVASRPRPVAVTRSGEDGAFSLVAPREGFWTLVARSAGRELVEVRLWPLLEPAQVELAEPWRRPGEPSSAAQLPEEEVLVSAAPRRLAGLVVSRPNAAPIAGAWVWPVDDPGRAVVTSEDGSFILTAPPESGREIVLAAQGHFETTRAWPAPDDPERERLLVYLSPGFTLVGRVEDWRGRPVAGAEVRVHRADRSWLESLDWRYTGFGWARTGPDGGFAIPGLEPRYELKAVAVHPEYLPVAVEIDEPYSYRAALGQPAEVRMVLPRGSRVRGTVVDTAGRPLAGAEVTLASHELQGRSPDLDPVPPGALTAVAGPAGAFVLTAVPTGSAALAVEAPGMATRVIAEIEVPEGVLDLGTLELGEEAPLSGRVVDTRGEPVAGVPVRVFYATSVRDSSAYRRLTLPPTDAAGAFQASGLPPNTQVNLRAEVEGYFPLGIYVVAPSEEPVRMVLTPVALLEGRVIADGGRPVARVQVFALFAEGPGGLTTDSAWTDEGGRFLLERLMEGEAVLDVKPGPYLLSAPERVQVKAGETVRGVELRVTTGLEVSGRLLDSTGEPIRLAMVGCHDCPGVSSDQADFDGLYRIQGLRPGRITLYATQDGYVGTRAETEVGPGDATLDLVLERGAVVSGRVLGAAGEPAGRVVIALTGEPDDPSKFLQNGSVRDLTEPDGSFELLGIPDGTYRFVLSAPGEPLTDAVAWRLELPDPLTVSGAPVPDLAIRLPQLAAIRGRILGLSPEELAYVHLGATVTGPGAPVYNAFGKSGTVGPDGSFEVLDLLAGRYEVFAGLPDGRHASAEVEVLEGEPEVRLDLAFDP